MPAERRAPTLESPVTEKEDEHMKRTAIASAIVVVVGVALLSAALPAAGRGAVSQREDPAVFVTRIVGLIVADDYGRAWQGLLPAHKRVASRAEYVACELKTPLGLELRSVRVLRSAQKLSRVTGISAPVSVTSVTLRLTVYDPSIGTESTFTHAFSAVAVGPRWAWILTPDRYELYRSNACGS